MYDNNANNTRINANDANMQIHSHIREICMRFANLRYDHSGNVLLLSLLILSGIMIGGIAAGELAIRGIKSAKRVDAGAVAYYAAEAGIEDSLYHQRKTSPPPATHDSFTLSNGASVVVATTSGEPTLFTALARDSFIEFNLFEEKDLSVPSGIEALRISWDDACAGASGIELSYAEWTAAESVVWPGTFTKFRYSHTASPVTHAALVSDRGYRVRVQAALCDIQNVTINAFADDAAILPRDIPSRITFTSNATFGGAEQALLVRTPRAAPLSGIFDYAIFSECSINKDGVPTCP